MQSYTVNENNICKAVSDILLYRQIEILLLLYKDINFILELHYWSFAIYWFLTEN